MRIRKSLPTSLWKREELSRIQFDTRKSPFGKGGFRGIQRLKKNPLTRGDDFLYLN